MPRPLSSSLPIRHTADPAQTRAELAELRPDLVERYDAALPGARAAVMGRLLGALDREALPGLVARGGGSVSFPGVTVRYSPEAAAAFAVAEDGLAVTVRAGNGLRVGGPIDDRGWSGGPDEDGRASYDGGRRGSLSGGGMSGGGMGGGGMGGGGLGGRGLSGGGAAGPSMGAGRLGGGAAGLGSGPAAPDLGAAGLGGGRGDGRYAGGRHSARELEGPTGAGGGSRAGAQRGVGDGGRRRPSPHRAAEHEGANGRDGFNGRDGLDGRDGGAAMAAAAAGMAGGAVPYSRGEGGVGPDGWERGDADWMAPEAEPGAVVSDPGTLVRLLWPGSDLAAEIDNSVANMALARAAHVVRELPRAGDPDALAWAEQSIVDGHPLHPCARTRGGMTVADVLAYAPEHSPVIRLRRLRVPEDRWYGSAEPVLLAHPWQADHLRDRYPWLTDDGETPPVRPLMSLRTVVPVGGGPHFKTAVDVQMTSAVRTVSPAAVHNGPILSKLLRLVMSGLPIDVLAETGAGAVLVDGQPQRHLAYLTREAPRLADGEVAVPIALYGASPLLLSTVRDPYDFMALMGSLLFAPLVSVLDRGVALEAHGQNTLVVLRDHRPTRILYRDLGGVRVSGQRLAAAGMDVPPLTGDLPSDDPQVLRTKLSAAAFGTVAAELVAALTRHHGADPARLWGIVAAAIRDTGTADAPHLLRDPLPLKATTAMRLAADPLDDIWAYLDNPMAEHA